jgi:hypothetical protein
MIPKYKPILWEIVGQIGNWLENSWIYKEKRVIIDID